MIVLKSVKVELVHNSCDNFSDKDRTEWGSTAQCRQASYLYLRFSGRKTGQNGAALHSAGKHPTFIQGFQVERQDRKGQHCTVQRGSTAQCRQPSYLYPRFSGRCRETAECQHNMEQCPLQAGTRTTAPGPPGLSGPEAGNSDPWKTSTVRGERGKNINAVTSAGNLVFYACR